ncbi:MAG TPA: PAS domain-containing protein, partial [Gemmatimonadales bacterium]|nr:PAS domain-containing protein [Gemmatimonadales bacterium]
MYGLPVLCVVLAMALPAAAEPIVGSHSPLITLLLFALAVAVAAAALGFGAGLAVLILGATWFVLVARRYSPAMPESAALLSLALYALSAGGIALLIRTLHRARLGAEATARGATAEAEQLGRELAARRPNQEPQPPKEERYRTPADEAKDSAIFMLTPEGRHATWNKGIGRMLGYEKLEFLRTSPADLYTPEDQAQGVPEKELAEALELGAVSAERWMVRKDGTRLPVAVTITSVLDQRGELVGYGKRVRDLSEVKRIQEELRRHKEALELGYEAAGLGTWDHDLISGELRLDQPARAMLGLHLDDSVTYSRWAEALHPEDLGPAEELRETAIRDRQPLSTEFRVIWPDGTTHWIAAIGRSSYDPA